MVRLKKVSLPESIVALEALFTMVLLGALNVPELLMSVPLPVRVNEPVPPLNVWDDEILVLLAVTLNVLIANVPAVTVNAFWTVTFAAAVNVWPLALIIRL